MSEEDLIISVVVTEEAKCAIMYEDLGENGPIPGQTLFYLYSILGIAVLLCLRYTFQCIAVKTSS